AQLPAELQQKYGAAVAAGGFSLNEPAKILALPEPLKVAIQTSFVLSLGPVFLTASLVSLIAFLLTLAVPDLELRGAPHAHPAEKPELVDEDDELAAAEMEAKAAT